MFARNEVLDTDRYLENVAPLAHDPAVQAAVVDRVTTAVTERLDVAALTADALDAIESPRLRDRLDALASPLASSVESFIRDQVEELVHGDRFPQLWTNLNREAHEGVTALLTGRQPESLTVHDGTIFLDLGPVVAEARDRLVARGFGPAAALPDVSAELPLTDAAPVARARNVAAALDLAAWLLPAAAVVLFAVALLTAPDRRRGLLTGALCVAVGAALLWAALTVARTAFLNRLPETVRSPQAAAAIYDTTTRFLVAAAQTLTVLFLIVALVCVLAGPGRVVTALRRSAARGCAAIARGITLTGVPAGPVPGFLRVHHAAVLTGVVAAAVVWLVLWRHPGVTGVLVVAAVTAVVVVVVEVVARVGQAPPADTGT